MSVEYNLLLAFEPGVASAWTNRSALFIEAFEPCLVEIAETFFSNGDDIPVLVTAFTGDGVDFGIVACRGNGDAPMEDTEGGEDGVVDGYTGVVEEALVAGDVIKVVGAHDRVQVCQSWIRVRDGECIDMTVGL